MKRLTTFLTLWLVPLAALAIPNIEFAPLNDDFNKRVVIFIDSNETLSGSASKINNLTEGGLLNAIKAADASASFGSTQSFYGIGPFTQVVVVGMAGEVLTAAMLQDLGGHAVAELPANGEQAVAILTDNITTEIATPEAWVAMGAGLRDYHFDKYKKEANQTTPRHLVVQSTNVSAAKSKYEQDLRYLVQGVYLTRDMASEPGKSIYPQSFVDNVSAQFEDIANVEIKVLSLEDMENYNMGALMGVGHGSEHDPLLLVIEYMGGDNGKAPIALVGKGITFDTGGISLKKNDGMWGMKSDLSGAAAVAGTMLAVASRGEAVNLVGLMPLAENMPADDAIRPGDVLTTMQGTTIEIISTDAEGRLILADAVRYAQDKYEPGMLINIATLTGSAGRALSDEYAALITREWDLSERMMAIGEASGELVWPLPLHPNHFKQIKSDIADIKNSGAGNPGASIGAAVVGTFIDEDLTWVHLDIAGVDWLNNDIAVVPKGAQGWGVRFLDQLIRENR